MKLTEFTGYVKISDITDTELLKDIQSKLGVTSDGILGPQTIQAFTEFKRKAHLAEPEFLGASTAQALIRSKPTIITMAQARAVFGRSPSQAQLDDLNSCLHRFDITTPARINHFLAQVHVESGGLKWMKELADGRAYEFRKDLGNKYPGDGPKYRGSGVIQLTGRHNYTLFGQYVEDPEVVRQGCNYVSQKYPFTSAGWFWMRNGLNKLVDSGATVKQVTRRVNGGFNHLHEREVAYFRSVGVGIETA